MSNISASQPFDFWEFVSCSRCHLAFASEPGAPLQTPFWLTECGHIVCNNHLNADQSCAQCGERGIQLVPLQHDLEAPMSDWFRSVPHAFDGAANAAKFQQETMAAQLRHYKSKYIHHRAILDQVKGDIRENKALRREVDDLRAENDQLRRNLGYNGRNTGEPSDYQNANGKRPMTGLNLRSHGGTSSSPRSIITPIGPNRLTLPARQAAPSLSTRQDDQHDHDNSQPPRERPGTGRFVEQYAYAPPQTPQFQGQSLSHSQTAPVRQSQARKSQEQPQRSMMPPQSLPLRQVGSVKQTASGQMSAFPTLKADGQIQKVPQRQDSAQLASRDRGQMAPPPPPPPPRQVQDIPRVARTPAQTPRLRTHNHNAAQLAQPSYIRSHASQQPPQSSRRFQAPTSNRFKPISSGATIQQRFMPDTPSTGTQRFVAPFSNDSGSRTLSRAAVNLDSTGASLSLASQRMPFVPGAQGGFR